MQHYVLELLDLPAEVLDQGTSRSLFSQFGVLAVFYNFQGSLVVEIAHHLELDEVELILIWVPHADDMARYSPVRLFLDRWVG